MQLEASPSSILRVTLEPGDELVESLKRALGDHANGFVLAGSGEVEDAEVLVLQSSGSGRTHRKLAGAAELLSLTAIAGERGLEVRATLASDAETSVGVFGGILLKATVVSVEVRAAIPTQAAPPVVAPSQGLAAVRSTQALPQAPPVPTAPPSAPAAAPAPTVSAAPPAPAPAPSAPASASPAPVTHPPQGGPPLPPKLRRAVQPESYPEEGDIVTHFAFGRCVVVFSDGERLRLQQERDSRVREVAMSMLRIEEPTMGEDGKRHWELVRKN